MEQFRVTAIQAETLKDPTVWSFRCSRDVMLEFETRRKLRRKAKELSVGHLEGDSIEREFDIISLMTPAQRLAEFQIRELYWKYFRVGNAKLAKYHDMINEKFEKTEYLISHPQDKKKVEAVEKMKVYIKDLEEKIEANFHDIDQIQNVFKTHHIRLEDDPFDQDEFPEERKNNTKKNEGPAEKAANFFKEIDLTSKKKMREEKREPPGMNRQISSSSYQKQTSSLSGTE